MAEQLSCVKNHTAVIYERGGGRIKGPLFNLSKVKYERGRDVITEASIRIEGDACESQLDFLQTIDPHRHELVLFRGKDRAWEGPLHRANIEERYAEIVAKDVLAYAAAQPLTQTYDNRNENATEVSTRIGNILQYELTHGRTQFYSSTAEGAAEAVAEWTAAGGVATPVAGGWSVQIPAFEDDALWPAINVVDHIVVHHWPNEARTATYTVPYEMTVHQHLAYLARYSGIDYTVIGRAIHIWDVSRSLGRLREWTEADYTTSPKLTKYGADHAQAAYSVGQDGAYGSALNLRNMLYYGPWTSLYTLYNEEGTYAPSQAELDSQAARNLAGRSPVPLEVRIPDNSTIILSDTLRLNDLVPGMQVPLRAAFGRQNVVQMQKIDHVTITEDDKGERIQVTLTPATRSDSDVEEP